jgi:hypothetical protein
MDKHDWREYLEVKYAKVSGLETMLLIRVLVEEISEIREQLDEQQELLENLKRVHPNLD